WYRMAIASSVTAAMALTPIAWSVDVINHPSSINPAAGPISLQLGGFGGGMGGPGPGGPGMGGPGPGGPGMGGPGMGGPGSGGPGSGGKPNGGFGGAMFGEQDNTALIEYLQANRGNTKYLVATFGAQTAAPLTTATGDNILPIGGFDGQDPAPTLAQFKEMVSAGELRFVLADGKGAGAGGKGETDTGNEIQSWVIANCRFDANAPAGSALYVCPN
ncbi:MAG: 4-amino-4-deoxy-L-arabinose transferase, partial [Actinomycetes bacterium]